MLRHGTDVVELVVSPRSFHYSVTAVWLFKELPSVPFLRLTAVSHVFQPERTIGSSPSSVPP